MRSAYWSTSVYCEPPNPRLVTGSGFMSATSEAQRAILEEPVKTIPPGATGCVLSCCSRPRIVGSQFCCANAVAAHNPPNVAASANKPIAAQFHRRCLIESLTSDAQYTL